MSARALALEHVGIAGQELVQLVLKLSCRQTHLLILEMETNNYLVDHLLRVVESWLLAKKRLGYLSSNCIWLKKV